MGEKCHARAEEGKLREVGAEIKIIDGDISLRTLK